MANAAYARFMSSSIISTIAATTTAKAKAPMGIVGSASDTPFFRMATTATTSSQAAAPASTIYKQVSANLMATANYGTIGNSCHTTRPYTKRFCSDRAIAAAICDEAMSKLANSVSDVPYARSPSDGWRSISNATTVSNGMKVAARYGRPLFSPALLNFSTTAQAAKNLCKGCFSDGDVNFFHGHISYERIYKVQDARKTNYAWACRLAPTKLTRSTSSWSMAIQNCVIFSQVICLFISCRKILMG